MFVGARIGGKAKEENAEANVNFKKEANKEPPEAGGPSTSRTTGVSVDKPGMISPALLFMNRPVVYFFS